MTDTLLDDELLPEQLVLSDLVSRVLDKGVVINAHVTISLADVDLVELDLRLLISSVASLQRRALSAAGERDANAALRPDTAR